MPVTRIEKFSCKTVGEQTREVIGDRREVRREEKSEEKRSQKRREVRREEKLEEKSEEKRRLEREMSDDHSDGEGRAGHETEFVDRTGNKEFQDKLKVPDFASDSDPGNPSGGLAVYRHGRPSLRPWRRDPGSFCRSPEVYRMGRVLLMTLLWGPGSPFRNTKGRYGGRTPWIPRRRHLMGLGDM